MKNLNKILKVVTDIQDDIILLKTEKKEIQVTDGYYKKIEIEYTIVIKFKDE